MTSDVLSTNTVDISTANNVDSSIADETNAHCEDKIELLVKNWYEDKTTRVGFVQKVLAIKLLQTLLIGLILGVFTAWQYVIYWHIQNNGTHVHLIVISTITFAISGLLICCKARHKNPYRYMFLIALPFSFAVFVSILAVIFQFAPMIALAFLTYVFAVFFVLLYSVFALQTKLTYSAKYASFLAVIVQILVYGLTTPFSWVDPELTLGVAYISLVFTFNLFFMFWYLDIMTSNKYWHYVTPDNFVDAALNLHLDYYYLFINIVLRICRIQTEILGNLFSWLSHLRRIMSSDTRSQKLMSNNVKQTNVKI